MISNHYYQKMLFVLRAMAFAFFFPNLTNAQLTDSSRHVSNCLETLIDPPDSNLTFTGTKIGDLHIYDQSTGAKLTLSGYISTYYGYYSDEGNGSGFSKFPTIAPRNKSFGLNIAQFSTKYHHDHFRGNLTFHYGDIPASAWSNDFNMLQEANVGVQLHKGIWLDAGLFRTHIGLESIQPRENMTISLATTTYFEPYFLSGAKLSWIIHPKFLIQVNAFNGFNNFIENNPGKAFGFSSYYEHNSHFNITYNLLCSDESPKGKNHLRIYNNIYGIYKSRKWTVAGEVNYGTQQQSQLKDSTQTAQLFSSLLALKYSFAKKTSVYGRYEIFLDEDEILTGPVLNANHNLVGLNISGYTLGFEFKPLPNSYLRLESRYLHTLHQDEVIFNFDQQNTRDRIEALFAFGVWF